MHEAEPTGLSPVTPPIRDGRAAPNHVPGAPAAAVPIAGRPITRRISVARRSLRLAADVSQKLTRSMRGAAKQARKVSFTAWCWIKFKTQWQFWLLLIALIAGWWWGMQKPALAALDHAKLVYQQKDEEATRLQARCNELHQAYEPLRRGDPYAWEKLARRQLSWKQQSETVTVERRPGQDFTLTPGAAQ